MGTPIGQMIIRNEDTEQEVRYALVNVVDIKSRRESVCVDVYSSSNELIRRIGHTQGPVVFPNGVVTYGDTLTRVNETDKRLIELLMNPVVSVLEEGK